jgi:ectoine hydroxylase-related dioxygenase (phytanoyl-CoA dioxygenase family)
MDDKFIELTDGKAIMIALDPYTSLNGSTVVIPKSHTWGPHAVQPPKREDAISVEMPSGSIVYFLSTLWHGGGANKTSSDRRALTVQYCQPWIRQIENYSIAVGWDKVLGGKIDERIVDMLGYRLHPPFIGYVDGMSPKRGARIQLQRMLEDAKKGPSKL